MGQNLFWTYAFNIVLNSALSFFTTIFFLKIFLSLFRIKHPRAKLICLLLPFLKISIDFCLYHFSSWALLYGINPLFAEKGTRNFGLMFFTPFTNIQFTMQDGKTFSIADIISLWLNPLWIKLIVFAIFIGTAISLILFIIHLFKEKKYIFKIVQNSSTLTLEKLNPSLTDYMNKKRITLKTSLSINSPCTTKKTVLFPPHLINTLSKKEIEAVIAHELAHFRLKDHIFRLFCIIVASIFWWIPTNWWLKRVEALQEETSDLMVDRFNVSNLDLASALLKTAKNAKNTSKMLMLSFVGRSSIKKRIEKILLKQKKQSPILKAIQYGLLVCALFSILLGKLWIF